MSACNCIGPQNGDPRCPCMMNRRKGDPRYFYEPKDAKGYFQFVSQSDTVDLEDMAETVRKIELELDELSKVDPDSWRKPMTI